MPDLVQRARGELRTGTAQLRAAVTTPPGRAGSVFVCGPQKSGSTAVGYAVAAALGTSVSHDLRREIIAPGWDRAVAEGWPLSAIRRRNPLAFRCGVVKEPNLWFWLPDIAREHPGADRLVVVRDPLRTALAICDRLDADPDSPVSELAGFRLRAWHQVLSTFGRDATGTTTVLLASARLWAAAVERARSVPGTQILNYDRLIGGELETCLLGGQHRPLRLPTRPVQRPTGGLARTMGSDRLAALQASIDPLVGDLWADVR